MENETTFTNITGKYTYNSETGVLRIISADPVIASRTIRDQMMGTELFPKQFTINAIIYSTKKGDSLTSLIVGGEIKKFLTTGLNKTEKTGKSFSEYLKEAEEQIMQLKINVIVYDPTHHRFLFHKGVDENTVFPISRNISIDTVPTQAINQKLKQIGLDDLGKDKMFTLWTYVRDDLKAYNRLVIAPEGYEPEEASGASEFVWVAVKDIHKVGTNEDIVALFNIEEKLHQIIDATRDEVIDYVDIVDHIMD